MTEKMLFTAVFLLVFFMTALATIMGAAKIKPFHKMAPKWVNILIGPLLVELAVAVIGVFTTLYEPKVEKHNFVADYRDYMADWRKGLSHKDEQCIENYLNSETFNIEDQKPCIEIIQAYNRKKASNNQKGVGSIYLESDGNRYSGMAFYAFPGQDGKTVFSLVGTSVDNQLQLTFSQEQGYHINSEGIISLRPPNSFQVNFRPLEQDEDVYEGKLQGSDNIDYGVLKIY